MNMEDWKDDILNSTKGMQKASAPADAFAKIQQRLAEQRDQQPPIKRAGYGWMKIAAVIALVISSNIWAVSTYLGAENMTSEDASGYPQITTDFNLYDND